MQRQIFPVATAANPGARRTGGGFVADGLAEIYPATPSCADRLHGSVAKPMVSLITQQAWLNRLPLLVVTSGSAIGREGAMILLAALAASCFAQRLTPRQEWKLWIACGAAAGMAAAYRAPLAGRFIYSRSAVWHYDVGSLGPVIISAVVALLVSNLINHSDALLYSVQLSVRRFRLVTMR